MAFRSFRKKKSCRPSTNPSRNSPGACIRRPASMPQARLAHCPTVRFSHAISQKLPVSTAVFRAAYDSATAREGGAQPGFTHCAAAYAHSRGWARKNRDNTTRVEVFSRRHGTRSSPAMAKVSSTSPPGKNTAFMQANTASRHMRQTNLPAKSRPFRAWLRYWMAKVNPNNRAKMV